MALALRKEEGLGLGIAIAAHAALVAALLLRPETTPVVQPPERIEVTISEEVGLTSTAPQPSSPAAPSVAPTLGEPQPAEAPAEREPAPPEPAPPEPAPPPPRPAPRKAEPPSKPTPRATRRPTPTPKATPKPKAERPAPEASPKKAPEPKAHAQKAPALKAATKAPAAKAPAAKAPAAEAPAKSNAPAGGSRIGDDFLKGVTGGSSSSSTSTSPSAATIGPAVRSSLASAISRQLKPKWQAPQGPDAEDLVTILSFNLNRDGSLAGAPTIVRQLGISDVNRNQADRHAEQAIRAVRLAAPFDLPEEYYDAWKRVSQFRFDKRLSQ
ncbi:hypothetical protein ABVV53_02215 [Novosphingobium sp. RD2P27]|uniref:Cell division and transport-associated protein TolA n=1 Tax=Novosphingobium kalidii TaxID=3230299 RepID=A0ABV2CXF0_9SPHN